MKIRAIIFDVYATLLRVGAPPADADARWNRLFEEVLGELPPLDRTEFSVRANHVIAQRHAVARAQGIQWPEILWPSIVLEVLPDLIRLPAQKLDEFIFQQMQIGRTLSLADQADDCLQELRKTDRMLGIASNSQDYTLRELGDALRGVGLKLSIFDPHLCFWSFENGFSKPDPHVFRILAARLEARGVNPGEILMVGDRLDNDIEPARAQGWQTWHLTSEQLGVTASGNWRALLGWLAEMK